MSKQKTKRNTAMWLLREKGWSYAKIGKKYNRHGARVREIVQRYEAAIQGLSLAAYRTTQAEKIKVERDAFDAHIHHLRQVDGMSLYRIGKHLKRSDSFIRRAYHRHRRQLYRQYINRHPSQEE